MSSFCSAEPFCSTGWACGLESLLLRAVLITGCFLTTFYSLSWILYPRVEQALKKIPSKYANEETRYWFAWHVVSLLHCCVLLSISLPPLAGDRGEWSDEVLFGTPRKELSAMHNATILGGLVFLSFILYDIIVIAVHKLTSGLMIVHHMCFIAYGSMVMYHCFLPFISLSMMSMEVSTVFLNFYSFFRNRLPQGHLSVKVAFIAFAITYAVLRILGQAYLILLFCRVLRDGTVRWDLVDGGGISQARLGFILVCLLIVFGLQCVWGCSGIAPKLQALLKAKKSNGSIE